MLSDLRDEIEEKKLHPTEKSYTAYLLQTGMDKICKKIGEESAEVIIAAKNADAGDRETCGWRCARNRPICSITYPCCGKEPASASTTSWPYWKNGPTSREIRKRSGI